MNWTLQPSTITPHVQYNGTPDQWIAASGANRNDVLHGGVSLRVDFGETDSTSRGAQVSAGSGVTPDDTRLFSTLTESQTRPSSSPSPVDAVAEPAARLGRDAKAIATTGVSQFGAGNPASVPPGTIAAVNGDLITRNQLDETVRSRGSIVPDEEPGQGLRGPGKTGHSRDRANGARAVDRRKTDSGRIQKDGRRDRFQVYRSIRGSFRRRTIRR